MRLDDGRLVVNPGSVGLQAYDDDHGHPHVMENGTPHARYAIAEQGRTVPGRRTSTPSRTTGSRRPGWRWTTAGPTG
jgi:hypothetical protein